MVEPVHVAASDRDGRSLVAGLEAGNTRVVDLATGQHVLRLRHDGEAKEVFVSPDGAFAAVRSGWEDHPWDVGEGGLSLDLWRLPGGAHLVKAPDWRERPPARGLDRLERANERPDCEGLELEPNGAYDVLRDAVSGACVFWYKCHGAALSPDGSRLVTRHGARDELWLREPATGRALVRFAHGDVEADEPFFLRGGALVAAALSDRRVRAWDAATGRPAWSWLVPPAPPTLEEETELGTWRSVDAEPSRDGQFVVVDHDALYGGGSPVRLLRAETGVEAWSFTPRSWGQEPECRTPDGRLAIVSVANEDDVSTRVVDVATGKVAWEAGDEETRLSPDGRLVVARGRGESATVREVATGREVWRTRFAVLHADFSGDGRHVLAATGSGGLAWLDAQTGAVVVRIHFFADGSWAALDPAGVRWDAPGDEPPRGLLHVGGVEPLSPGEVHRLREPRLLARLKGNRK